MQQPSAALFSSWTPRIALFAGGLILSAILMHRLLGMSTPLALNLFLVAFGLAALTLLLGSISLIDVWRRGTAGAGWSVIGMAMAACIFAWPLYHAPSFVNLPRLNDVATDLQSPPRFVALAKQRPRGANPAEYPKQRFAELQQASYPDLRPLYVNRSLEDTFEIALETLKRMRFQIVAEEAPVQRRPGTIEAIDRTLLIGFYDDVAVRVSADQNRSRIDVRSASRYGEHDLGRNASRLRRILSEMQARIEASVSTPGQRFARIKSRLDKAKAVPKRQKDGDPKSAARGKSPGPSPSDAQRAPQQKAKQPARAGGRSRDIQD